VNELLTTLFSGDYGLVPGSAETVLFVILLSFVIGQFIGWIYMITHEALSYSRSFVSSLVVLPVLVGLMMMLMSGSIIVAFGLLAVFAVVRFRNVLKDTRDTSFILWAIMEGLAVGTLRCSTALIGALGVGIVLLYLRLTGFGTRHRYDAVLGLQLAGDNPTLRLQLARIIDNHCARATLASQQRIGAGATALSYRVLLRDPTRGAELCRALENTAGISEVTLFLREDEAEL